MNIVGINSVIIIGKGTGVTVTTVGGKYKKIVEQLSKIPRSKQDEDFISELQKVTPKKRINVVAENCEIYIGK